MRRRWFALISFTALLFPSYPYGDHSTSLCVRPFAFARTVVPGHVTVAYVYT
jgi:hypothetical protein